MIASIMFPGTAVFNRFEYPSFLPQGAQVSVAAIARNVMLGLGKRGLRTAAQAASAIT